VFKNRCQGEEMKAVILRNGIEYKVGDRVEVPDPSKQDSWKYGFVGRVDSFEQEKDELWILVKDSSGEVFKTNPYRLKNLSIPI
jgi:hypothetical protein